MKDALLSRHDIKIFCQSNDYLVSENKIARWIDQKCTADVVTVVADCVINYIEDELNHNISQEFTSLDIWRSKYAQINISYIFKKPDIIRKSAKNEYDKFFQQPLELLAFANILIKFKRKNKNFYKINNFELLRYIAMREKMLLFFNCLY